MTMTRAEAEALAIKRNEHLGKSLRAHKTWQAQHDSVKGWHVALVDWSSLRPAPLDTDDGLPTLADVIGIGLAMIAREAMADEPPELYRSGLPKNDCI